MTRRELEHHALLYRDIEEYLAVTVPYLRAGLTAGDQVMAVVPEPGYTALQDSLGAEREDMDFVRAEDWYKHPVQTIKDYDRIIRGSAPRRIRVIAEPVWYGRDPVEVVEWTRFESVVNVAFASSGARAICPYDQAGLPPEVIDRARETHPALIDGGRPRGNADYLDPEAFGIACDQRARLPEPPPGTERLPLHTEDDLHAVRQFVAERAVRYGLDATAVGKLVMAVNEAATNALRHGTPPMAVRAWPEGPDLVCEIGDHGYWRPGPLTGFVPPRSALDTGFGLWSVRLLVDHVQIRAGWEGTFVRLRMRGPARLQDGTSNIGETR